MWCSTFDIQTTEAELDRNADLGAPSTSCFQKPIFASHIDGSTEVSKNCKKEKETSKRTHRRGNFHRRHCVDFANMSYPLQFCDARSEQFCDGTKSLTRLAWQNHKKLLHILVTALHQFPHTRHGSPKTRGSAITVVSFSKRWLVWLLFKFVVTPKLCSVKDDSTHNLSMYVIQPADPILRHSVQGQSKNSSQLWSWMVEHRIKTFKVCINSVINMDGTDKIRTNHVLGSWDTGQSCV